MNTFRFFVALLFISVSLVSCKNDSKNDASSPNSVSENSSEKMTKAEDKKAQKKVANSLMAKLMATQETKTFISNAVSAGITDMLSKDAGPYTLLVPSNEAFVALPEILKDNLANPKNKETLAILLKNHIVAEDLTSAEIQQSIKKNGTLTLKTLGGENLMAYMEGADIIFKDSKGVMGKLGKSDILATNGKVHVIDAVLTAAR